MPANAIPFESVGEPVRDRLQYYNSLAALDKQKPEKKSIYKH